MAIAELNSAAFSATIDAPSRSCPPLKKTDLLAVMRWKFKAEKVLAAKHHRVAFTKAKVFELNVRLEP